MKLVHLLFITFFLSNSTLHASKIDTNFIYRFNKNATIRIGSYYKNNGFAISPISTDKTVRNNKIIYSPNMNSSIGGGISFRDMVIQGFVQIPGVHRDEKRFGKTKYLDLQVNMFLRKFGGNIYYRKFNGVYMAQPEKIIDGWNNAMPNPIRNDIGLKLIGGEAYYVFNNKKYSMPAVCKYTEQQQRNAGSVLVLYDVTSIQVNADSTIIPSNQKQFYTSLDGLRNCNFLSSNVLLGYTYTFSFKKHFFFTPFISAGTGIYKNEVQILNGTSEQTNVMFRGNCRVRTGYNGSRFFCGLVLDANVNVMPNTTINYTTQFLTVNVVAGYRLNMLKKLSKKFFKTEY